MTRQTNLYQPVVLLLIANPLFWTSSLLGQELASPDKLGNFSVGYERVEFVDPARNNRVVRTDIWYPVDPSQAQGELASYQPLAESSFAFPSDVAILQASVSSAGPFPLIVNSHGGYTWSGQDSHVNEVLASHGFVVVAPDHTGESVQSATLTVAEAAAERPIDVSFIIDEMVARDANLGDSFSNRLQPDNVGIFGLSFGAYTALATPFGDPALGLPGDSRIKATMPISTSRGAWIGFPINYESTIPTMLLTGTRDGAVPAHHSDLFREFAQDPDSKPVYSALIDSAVHSSFTEVCQRFEYAKENAAPEAVVELYTALTAGLGNCRDRVIDNAEAVRITTLYATAFFQSYLYENANYLTFLTPEYTEQNLQASIRAALFNLQAGDANEDGEFNRLDLDSVLLAGKYQGGIAGWGEGDWDVTLGGAPGVPIRGDGRFNHLDLVASLATGFFEKGPYAGLNSNDSLVESAVLLQYDPNTGGLSLVSEVPLSSVVVNSSAGLFTGLPATGLEGSFDIDDDGLIFKASFDGAFSSADFGLVAATGLDELQLLDDITVYGTLEGGGHFDSFILSYASASGFADVDRNGVLDAIDIDLLGESIRGMITDSLFDINQSGSVDERDVSFLVETVLGTWFGDANLDGEFNSSDLVAVFQSGKYEVGTGASWSEGDWNTDGVFDSSDFVSAFQGGGYEQGPRPDLNTVPEPTTYLILAIATVTVAARIRRLQCP